MSGIWCFRPVVYLGLILLGLCSTGLALECFNCQAFSVEKCQTKTTCSSPSDTCLKLTAEGESLYRCWQHSRCDIESIKTDFQLNKFSNSCCQKNLCNSAVGTSPAPTLLLSLVAVLLLAVLH
ncbi:CD59A glycoprotein-like [Pelodytes ibericus]